MTYLSGENLVVGYGGADILHGCSIDVSEGEIAVIVGPNGSGKSTAMKAVFGMLNLKSGRTLLCDYQLTSSSNFKGNNSLLVEITSKEFSSEIKERLRNQTNQRITTDFIRGLAHEIKNPLSGIRGSAQLLSNKLEEESLKEYTNLI